MSNETEYWNRIKELGLVESKSPRQQTKLNATLFRRWLEKKMKDETSTTSFSQSAIATWFSTQHKESAKGEEDFGRDMVVFLLQGKEISAKKGNAVVKAIKRLDPDLKTLKDALSEISIEENESPTPIKSSLESLIGTKWNEYHFSKMKSDGVIEDVITKGTLNIHSINSVKYRIDEPCGNPLFFEGKIGRENSSYVIVSLIERDSERKEAISIRLSYKTTARLSGTLSGTISCLDFDDEPNLSPTYLERKECDSNNENSKGNSEKYLSDSKASSRLKKIEKFFSFGPQKCYLHDDWDSRHLDQEMDLMQNNQCVKIITTFIPNNDKFELKIEKFAKDDKIRRKFKILFLDPSCQFFASRFFLMENNLKLYKKLLREQVNKFQIISEGCKKMTSGGVYIEIRFSGYWPVGMGFLIGNSCLFLGNMFATRTALDGSMLEIRDKESPTWKFFERDFGEIWLKTKEAKKPLGDLYFNEKEKIPEGFLDAQASKKKE